MEYLPGLVVIFGVNVGKYSIHCAHGQGKLSRHLSFWRILTGRLFINAEMIKHLSIRNG